MLNLSLTNPLRIDTHYSRQVDSKEQSLIFEVRAQLKPTTFQNKYVVQLKLADGKAATGKLLLNVSKDSTQQLLKVGQHLANTRST